MRRLIPLLGGLVWLAVPAFALAHGAAAPAPRLPDVLFAWSFDLLAVALIAAAAAMYLYAVRRVNARHPGNPHPRVRTWCWFGGLVAIGLALLSPIEAYEGSLFSVHMVQHMLLQLVAAPLLLAGGPITLALRASSPSVRRGLLSVMQSRVVHVLSFPLVAWLLFAATKADHAALHRRARDVSLLAAGRDFDRRVRAGTGKCSGSERLCDSRERQRRSICGGGRHRIREAAGEYRNTDAVADDHQYLARVFCVAQSIEPCLDGVIQRGLATRGYPIQ